MQGLCNFQARVLKALMIKLTENTTENLLMKRTIFIPTDFSEASLSLVSHTLARAGDDEIEVVLTHCFFLTDSIVELLSFDKNDLFQSLKSSQFNVAFRKLRKKFSQAKVEFRWEIFTGFTQAAFRNFVSGNQITEAVIPQPYFQLTRASQHFDPTPYVYRSRLPVTFVSHHAYLMA